MLALDCLPQIHHFSMSMSSDNLFERGLAYATDEILSTTALNFAAKLIVDRDSGRIFEQDQANKRTSTRDDDDDSCTLSITVGGGEIFQLCVTGYLREQIKSHFKDKLFGIVTNLQKRGKGKSDAQELIKHVYVVFKLDNYLQLSNTENFGKDESRSESSEYYVDVDTLEFPQRRTCEAVAKESQPQLPSLILLPIFMFPCLGSTIGNCEHYDITKMIPLIKELLPRLASILKNMHLEQDNSIDHGGCIVECGAWYVCRRKWTSIYCELLEMLKTPHDKGINRAVMNTFEYIAEAIGQQKLLDAFAYNLNVQD
ncbi:splicing factor 3B subunit 1-like protein [Tanacetum coccineum]